MTKTEIALKETNAADVNLNKLRRDRSNIIEAAISKARAIAEQKWEQEHAGEIEAATKKLEELREAYEEIRVQEIANNLPYPEGMIFTVWDMAYSKNYQTIKGDKKLYNVRLEVVRKDSQFGGNLSRYNRPNPGTIIGRRIKKDGSLSLKYDSIFNYNNKLQINVTPAEEATEN